MKKIYTIGYSKILLQDFIHELKARRINLLIDCRSIPYSRWRPDFNIKSLNISLNDSGIDYLWYGEHLGGKKENIDFDGYVNKVKLLSKRNIIVLMCACGNYKKCHRESSLKPAFQDVFEVVHIN